MEYAVPQTHILPIRGEEPLEKRLDPRFTLREYVDSEGRLVAKELCYAKPTCRSWPFSQGSMGDISQLKEDLELMITEAQQEVDLKLMKSVWDAHLRTPEEDEI